jgi:hypothetical protein
VPTVPADKIFIMGFVANLAVSMVGAVIIIPHYLSTLQKTKAILTYVRVRRGQI